MEESKKLNMVLYEDYEASENGIDPTELEISIVYRKYVSNWNSERKRGIVEGIYDLGTRLGLIEAKSPKLYDDMEQYISIKELSKLHPKLAEKIHEINIEKVLVFHFIVKNKTVLDALIDKILRDKGIFFNVKN